MFAIIKILNLFFVRAKLKVFLFILFTLIAMILEIFSIGMIFPVFSTLLSNEPLNINFISNKISLSSININSLLIILLISYLLKNLYLLFFNWWQAKFSNQVYVEASSALLKKYFLDDYIFFSKYNHSSLVQNVYVETKNFAATIAIFLNLLLEISIIFSISVLLLFINFKVSLMIILIFLIIFFIYNAIIKSKTTIWGIKRLKFSKLQLKNLNEIFDGIKTIKAYGVENNFSNIYSNNIKGFAQVKTYQDTFISFPKILLEVSSILLISMIIYYLLLRGQSLQLIIPYLAVVTGAAFRLIPSVNRIIVNIQNLNFAKSSIKILQREFDSKKKDFLVYEKLPKINFNKKVLIKNFDFKYKTNNFIFKNENFLLNKFDCLGIAGQSGTGKTTLIDLLMCLLKFDNGEIIIDDYKLKTDLEYKAWQKKIGYVAQKTFLVNDTIRRNIALGISDEKINDKTILSAIEDSQLGDFVRKCSNGINHDIQEKGINISEGEKQRLGIARALYNNSDLIILDEPTSSLDEVTEEKFLDFLSKFKNKKTLILISHKKSNMKICNRVIKIESLSNGQKKITEST